jgi:hypothetical protein
VQAGNRIQIRLIVELGRGAKETEEKSVGVVTALGEVAARMVLI